MELSRRTFLAGAGAAVAAAAGAAPEQAAAAISPGSWATMIDLTLCDGCPDKGIPACVAACRETNAHKFPEPDPAMLKPYWPQKKFEDWSGKRHLTDRLTPYNWTFVQRTRVEHAGEVVEVAVPRRCMHCDSPACVKLCPFGVNRKYPDGMVAIDPYLCVGGAKCRTVCPWSVPQRQAGVGVYTLIDPVPAGGGVMFKCDLCRDRLLRAQQPGCIPACPKKALSIGRRDEIYGRAADRAGEVNGELYGMEENGGTSTLYVSRVPFTKINQALLAQAQDPTKVMQLHRPDNLLEQKEALSWLTLAAPLAGAAAAFLATARTREEGER